MHSNNTKVKENFTVIIAAAGSGKRMNLEGKKQFLEFCGMPLYLSSVKVCIESPLVDDIVIVTSPDDVEIVKNHIKEYGISKVKAVVPGGKERQDSIFNALEHCSEGIIAVQDGARPFLREEYLSEAYMILTGSKKIDGVVVSVPVKDTIKVVSGSGEILTTPNRNGLYQAQTPQVFKSKALKEAYLNARQKNILGTDDSSLLEIMEKDVRILLGSYDNIKITTIEDLKYLQQN